MNDSAETMEQEAVASEPTIKRRARQPKAATVNVRIKSMGDRYASGGVNIVAGIKGKLKPGDICAVPEAVASTLEGCDLIEFTREAENCRLVGNEIFRD